MRGEEGQYVNALLVASVLSGFGIGLTFADFSVGMAIFLVSVIFMGTIAHLASKLFDEGGTLAEKSP